MHDADWNEDTEARERMRMVLLDQVALELQRTTPKASNRPPTILLGVTAPDAQAPEQNPPSLARIVVSGLLGGFAIGLLTVALLNPGLGSGPSTLLACAVLVVGAVLVGLPVIGSQSQGTTVRYDQPEWD